MPIASYSVKIHAFSRIIRSILVLFSMKILHQMLQYWLKIASSAAGLTLENESNAARNGINIAFQT